MKLGNFEMSLVSDNVLAVKMDSGEQVQIHIDGDSYAVTHMPAVVWEERHCIFDLNPDFAPVVALPNGTTDAQRRALFEHWQRWARDNADAPSWSEFASDVVDYGAYVGVTWRGMFLGIEPDGYAHT